MVLLHHVLLQPVVQLLPSPFNHSVPHALTLAYSSRPRPLPLLGVLRIAAHHCCEAVLLATQPIN